MKCPRCKFYNICKGRLNETVENCVRFKSVEQTNEEYLRSLNTEQLAEWIADKINDTVYSMSIDAWAGDVDRDEYWQRKSEWVEWLKQPHEG